MEYMLIIGFTSNYTRSRKKNCIHYLMYESYHRSMQHLQNFMYRNLITFAFTSSSVSALLAPSSPPSDWKWWYNYNYNDYLIIICKGTKKFGAQNYNTAGLMYVYYLKEWHSTTNETHTCI